MIEFIQNNAAFLVIMWVFCMVIGIHLSHGPKRRLFRVVDGEEVYLYSALSAADAMQFHMDYLTLAGQEPEDPKIVGELNETDFVKVRDGGPNGEEVWKRADHWAKTTTGFVATTAH